MTVNKAMATIDKASFTFTFFSELLSFTTGVLTFVTLLDESNRQKQKSLIAAYTPMINLPLQSPSPVKIAADTISAGSD